MKLFGDADFLLNDAIGESALECMIFIILGTHCNLFLETGGSEKYVDIVSASEQPL